MSYAFIETEVSWNESENFGKICCDKPNKKVFSKGKLFALVSTLGLDTRCIPIITIDVTIDADVCRPPVGHMTISILWSGVPGGTPLDHTELELELDL